MTTWLETCQEARDTFTEMLFLNTYGSPLLQALVGLGPQHPLTLRRIEQDVARDAIVAQKKAELERQFEAGSLQAGAIRALVYISIGNGGVDERGFAALKQIRESQPPAKRMSLARFKEILREQFLLVHMDEERALATLPALLGKESNERKLALEALRRVLSATGVMSDEAKRRLRRIEAIFGSEERSKNLANVEAGDD
jgi:hypothetical protein